MRDWTTKADLRALREEVGLSQSDLADAVGVAPKTVRRWEDPDAEWEPPEDVWELLEGALDVQRQIVEHSVETANHAFEAAGNRFPGVVTLTYFKTQRQYDELGRDEGPFGVANANARATARELRRLGYKVRFEYPESEGNQYRQAAGRP